MNGKQSATLVLSALLATAHLWQGGTLGQLGGAVWNAPTSEQPNPTPYLSAPVKDLLVSAGFVAVLTWFAGLSDDTGNVSLGLIVLLWALFLINTQGHPFKKK